MFLIYSVVELFWGFFFQFKRNTPKIMMLTLYNSRRPTCSLIISIGVGCEKIVQPLLATIMFAIYWTLGHFCAAPAFRIPPSPLIVCLLCHGFSPLVFSLPVFEPFVCLFLSVLDRPVVCGSSGLLLFSCFLRYPSHRFTVPSSNFKPSPLCFHTLVPDLKLAPSGFPKQTQEHSACLPFRADLPKSLHARPTFAVGDKIITVYMHLGTPTVDPRARSTIGEAQESIRSQLLCNWLRY